MLVRPHSFVTGCDKFSLLLLFFVGIGELGVKLLLIFQADFKESWRTHSLGRRQDYLDVLNDYCLAVVDGGVFGGVVNGGVFGGGAADSSRVQCAGVGGSYEGQQHSFS